MGSNSSILKKLAGETAIYGVSTILARFINFLFLPLYTYYLTTVDYGVLTEFMAYIAMFQVVLTLGLETGCFRFANKEGALPAQVFSTALLSVSAVSLVFLLVMVFFGEPISVAMGYPGYYLCYVYIGLILAIDSFTAILFAKLRFETKAWKFAVFKTTKILTEVGSNVLLFLWFPKFAAAHPDTFMLRFVSATPDFSYPIFSICVSCVVALLLFVPDILKLRFELDRKVWKGLMLYSLPLMIAGLPGVINDFLDRILFRYFNVDDTLWRSDLGIYQAAVKVAVIMSLFVQMFRFAAEPFFFARARDKGSKELYAQVMEYFVAFCMLVFLGIIFYIDIIQFIVGRDFRVGMGIVPIMLLAYMMLGMLFNVSMWYKLSDKSSYAIWITMAGLLVTTVVNVLFLAKYSYWAAAWGHFASYLVMLVVSTLLGNKYYRIPYKWCRILGIISGGLLLYGLNLLIPGELNLIWKLAMRTVLIFVYIAAYFLFVRYGSKNSKQV
ncbi:MAG: oligosaccharide flippase family protein [Bacteroidales bacterium]|nr:oligosaccharide flippase family protein [Bacteroidales bacterium]